MNLLRKTMLMAEVRFNTTLTPTRLVDATMISG